MYCRYCGEQIEDDSFFCRYCGKKVNGYQSVNHQFLNLFKGKRQQVEDNIYFEEQTYQQQILIESFSLNDFIKKNGEIKIEEELIDGCITKSLYFISKDGISIKVDYSKTIGDLDKKTIQKYSDLLFVNHFKGSIYVLDINNGSESEQNTKDINTGNSKIRIISKSESIGATIEIDGITRGKTPLFIDEVQSGVHIIKAKASFFEDYVEIVDIKNDSEISICVDFNKEPADLYVDLGLSVKWATCNLGAQVPFVSGDLYSWGEIKPKDTYCPDNYKFFQTTESFFGHKHKLTKYCNQKRFGFVDNKYELDIEDDAANVILGKDWRIPTKKEARELINNCIWKKIEIGEINGYQAISKINGKSIFIPFCKPGYEIEVSLQCCFWTSSRHVESDSDYASMATNDTMYNAYRYSGRPIRPVYTK